MRATDDAMLKLSEAMRVEYGAGDEFDIALGELVGKQRAVHDKRMRDAQAAELLPLGAEVAATRQHCHRSTVYRRVSRFQKVARQTTTATKG